MQKPSNATRRAARLVRTVCAQDIGPSRSRKACAVAGNIVSAPVDKSFASKIEVKLPSPCDPREHHALDSLLIMRAGYRLQARNPQR